MHWSLANFYFHPKDAGLRWSNSMIDDLSPYSYRFHRKGRKQDHDRAAKHHAHTTLQTAVPDGGNSHLSDMRSGQKED